MYAIIIFTSMVLYGVVHSLLASLQAKIFARRKWDLSADRYYRLAYNLFAVVSLLPVLILPVIFPDRILYRIPSPWIFLSLSVQALAVILLLLGLLETGPFTFLGIRQLFASRKEDENTLVQTGLYRYIRHPLYASGLLFIWLNPVMTINFLAFNLAASLYLIFGALVEERKLVHQFGEAYLHYRRETPMLIPFIRRRQEQKLEES